MAREDFDRARGHLAQHGAVSAEQQLLARLAARIEGARDQHAAEGAISQDAAVFARKGHALRHALVDDVAADLREAVDIGLAGAKVAAFNGVVKQPVNAVAVVLIVFDALMPPCAAMLCARRGPNPENRNTDLVTHFAQRGRGRRAGQARAHHNDGVLAAVGGSDQGEFEFAVVPFFFERPGRNGGIQG